MKTSIKTALVAALPFAALLWMTPPAAAHDGYRSYERRPTWSYAPSSRPWYSNRSHDWEQRRLYGPPQAYRENRWKYNKAMDRLARQEREAREKAYRNYDGNISDPRYQRRLAEIDRRYDHKRDKVERNLRKGW